MNKTGYQHQRHFDNVSCTLSLPVAMGDAFSLLVKKFAPSEFSHFLFLTENKLFVSCENCKVIRLVIKTQCPDKQCLRTFLTPCRFCRICASKFWKDCVPLKSGRHCPPPLSWKDMCPLNSWMICPRPVQFGWLIGWCVPLNSRRPCAPP